MASDDSADYGDGVCEQHGPRWLVLVDLQIGAFARAEAAQRQL